LNKLTGAGAILFILAGCSQQADDANPVAAQAQPEERAGATAASVNLGIDTANMDPSVKPGDDFERFVNGAWLDTFEIPPERSRWGTFTELAERNDQRLREVMDESMLETDAPAGSDRARSRDFFLSYMDIERGENLGLEPLGDDLARIEAATSHEDLIRLFALNLKRMKKSRTSVTTDGAPFDYDLDLDPKNTEQYIVMFRQGGLGLPGRDYYLSDDEKFQQSLAAYRAYVERILELAGSETGGADAAVIVALETRLAEAHWTAEQNRDVDARYNKYGRSGLAELTPGLDWDLLLSEAGLGDVEEIIIWQPGFYTAFDAAFLETPIEDWKTYLRFKQISSVAQQLSQDFRQAHFEMYGKALRGTDEPRERWQQAIDGANEVLAEIMSRVYLERYFPPEAHARMETMVENLRNSFGEAIDGLEWMAPETKREAHKKLASLTVHVGYPQAWDDYSQLDIKPDDLVGNMLRGRENIYQNFIDRLGGPPIYGKFVRATQEVNAYYRPETSELVFLAGILQPPFFDLTADDAVNYGAIGGVIGHEVSHAFDDQGRKIDEKGNLRDWWTEDDARQYEERASLLAAQYDGYEPLPGLHVNGRLTLGENIADLAGLTMAYRAYEKSLNEEEAAVIDGYTWQQRLLMGWAQIWRGKYRDGRLREMIVSDPHSPPRYRINGVVTNMPEFYDSFDVDEDGEIYTAPEDRVRIW
jgi:putative endopeptidase